MSAGDPAIAHAAGDADARRRIAEDFDHTLFVEAAAGTGKTTALVGRLIGLIGRGRARLDQVVALTFTEKAAGEMKLRLRAGLERARAADGAGESRGRLEQALAHLEVARIGTIHAFCADLLRERPVEAGVDPMFEVAPEEVAGRLLGEAFDTWFQRTLADPPPGVRRLLRRRPRGRNRRGPREALEAAAWTLKEHRDFEAGWRREQFDREATIDATMQSLEALGELALRASSATDYLARNCQEVRRFVEEVHQIEAVRGRDHDGLEADLRDLSRARSWRWRGGRRRYGPLLSRTEAVAQRDRVKMELEALVAACDADLAPLLREELRPVVAEYERLKARNGVLDFLDLLLKARDLVRDQHSVREALESRFTHYFVDEFQDTDPLQAEILMRLATTGAVSDDWRDAAPAAGRLFLVGDPKQSIYRFRRADVGVYEDVKRALGAHGAAVLHLSTSFRSVPSLQGLVNCAFEPAMQGEAERGQAGYVALQPHREEPSQQPSIVALPVPRPYGDYGSIVNWRIDESLPDAVGAFVHWLVEHSGWHVEDAETGQPVPVQARHVCILFRRLRTFWSDVSRGYVRALEARRVAHVLVGGRSFYDREEILAVRNALNAIEWPDDELRVFATLRGPLFAVGDDALLAFRYRVGSLHPLRRLPRDELDADDREIADALLLLAELHADRNRLPIADTIRRLLAAVRAHAGIAIWPTGEQALANCLRMMDLARRFERRGTTSFRAFVEHTEEQAQQGDSQDAPVVEEGTEGVRIMTVHRAKGLEFPVVVLADPTCRATRDVPGRHVDPARGLWTEPLAGCAPRELLEAAQDELERERHEAVRVAYVAATRARDLLVVPVVGDKKIDGWLETLNPVVYPHPRRKRKSEAAPGVPDLGEDSVLERPPNIEPSASDSIRPGRHRPAVGEHAVVWWDPAALELDREQQVGLRQSRILEADAENVAADASIGAHERWQSNCRETLSRSGVPSLKVTTATRLASSLPSAGDALLERDADQIEVLRAATRAVERPGGSRFGSLVHAILASVGLDGDRAEIDATADLQARLLGAPIDERNAAAVAAGNALAHPLLRRAARSALDGWLRRETPVIHRLADGSLVEGVVDLAFREAPAGRARWTVVDFKTDREIEHRLDTHRQQVCIYVKAIEAATGEPAAGALLVV